MMLLFHLSQVGVLQDLSLDEIGQIEGVNRSTPLIPNQSTAQEAAAYPDHDSQGAVFPEETDEVPCGSAQSVVYWWCTEEETPRG
jgi:hypothetical protein